MLNRAAVEFGVRAALALNCTVNLYSEFARKNYFYPDLPKAFQITQHDKPLAVNGKVNTTSRISRWKLSYLPHLREAGKSIHSGDSIVGSEAFCGLQPPILIDCDAPITSLQARRLATSLILQYAQVSDCKMENGSLRCDANISLHGNLGRMGKKWRLRT